MVTVAIPTIGEAPQLPTLVECLLEDGAEQVLLMVNREGAQIPVSDSARVARVDLFGESIYAEWNWAVRYVRNVNEGDGLLALLNDDVEIAPGSLVAIAEAMKSDDHLGAVGWDYGESPRPGYTLRPCSGTYRQGGIGGFAFMVRVATCPEVDEQFEWWGGDDDLMASIYTSGQSLAILEGAHVLHWPGTTARNHDWVHEAVARDRERMKAKFGKDPLE